MLDKGTADAFRIYHSNIRSIIKNVDELKIVLNNTGIEFDIIALTETWRLVDTTLLNIPNYDLIYNNGTVNQNDGVVIYIKSGLNYDYQIKDFDNIKVISLKVKYKNTIIHVTTIYRSPSTCPQQFNDKLYNYLKTISTEATEVKVIMGDINIDIMDSNEISQEYLNIMAEWGYTSAINNYTRVQGNSKSCIDHLFFNIQNMPNISMIPMILKTCISDHFSVVLQVDFPSEKEQNTFNQDKKYTFS
ncbi:hypothetical protein NQ317_008848 [Molorchus minor]|uniref:Endonuclease/exonuclease/phosphatase domain-containing protein n=1 Tax=Molorchus minor TaxID=1323400 RepID=A0ABQ9IPZ2_9CUCU|nr:hypothetical protein NQ317_008848 [Molorchus minor]